MRVVLDANVFVSGLIGREGSAPQLVLEAFEADLVDVVVSPRLIEELEAVLVRPKLVSRVTAKERNEYLARIQDHGQFAPDPEVPPLGVRDPKDEYIVALARGQAVDAIVSGDRDLLEAGLDAPPVLTPRQLLDKLAEVGD